MKREEIELGMKVRATISSSKERVMEVVTLPDDKGLEGTVVCQRVNDPGRFASFFVSALVRA